MEIHPTITLNENEIKIFETLKEILQINKQSTVLWVAGGWVRDKILGLQSDDIDIALDNMMGKDFAEMINAHLYPGQTKYGIIKKDAEHSKHLETASIKVHDIFIDLVNLRAEEYSEDSRNPQI